MIPAQPGFDVADAAERGGFDAAPGLAPTGMRPPSWLRIQVTQNRPVRSMKQIGSRLPS